ncbi:hypothetical protein BDV96DRAFT_694847 [Lophiotrema nucula]|uniref:Zn(2)-C6 fungal-type domain-containing protein n=1 Tax=Lophiotrema nucula TaxID=690887 RepID=A0A6A5YDV9_9PLEO|nr:hypothetical protein BDV96DRAFT_694847 [Lophiotrema nucula]
MASQNPMIAIVQKAANVCAYCRSRKQGCDRIIPRCSRCAAKNRDCDYTPFQDVHHHVESGKDPSAPLVFFDAECGPDLSPRGRSELLRIAADYLTRASATKTPFCLLVADIFDEWQTNLPALMDQYAAAIQPWLPALPLHLVWKQEYLEGIAHRDEGPSPILIMFSLLVARRPCPHKEHNSTNVLYTTIKQVVAVMQTSNKLHLDIVQAGLLVAAYECGQGLARQAHQTLSSCYALLNLIDTDTKRRSVPDTIEDYVPFLRSSVLVMDRMIATSVLDYSIPLVCPLSGEYHKRLEEALSYTVPPKPEPYVLGGEWKRIVTAQVTLVAGRVTEYVQALRFSSQPSEDYGSIDGAISSMVRQLMATNHEHTWHMCDAIALALMSLLALHQAQVQYGDPKDSVLAHLALQTSAQMAWDMCRNTVRIVVGKDVSGYPLAGLIFVFRAGVMAVETMGDSAPSAEVVLFLDTLRWFETRWSVGGEYVRLVEDIANQLKGNSMED